MEVSSLWSTRIEAPPSCVAFHPRRTSILVIGTYILHRQELESDQNATNEESNFTDNKTQYRTGSLIVYELLDTSLQRGQVLEIGSAVLDIEWSSHYETNDILAVATSTGSIELYSLSPANELQHLSTYQISDTATLVLDLLWHPKEQNTIAATLSSGEVLLCRGIDAAGNGPEISTLTTHTLEPWTLAFGQRGKQLLSGGDDIVLQCIGLTDPSSVLWSDRKTHQAGVTAILPLEDDLIVTGSYDDHIRLLHAPSIGRRRVLTELDLGGGVWRLKLLHQHNQGELIEDNNNIEGSRDGLLRGTSQRHIILASCMHAGSRLIQLTQQQASAEDQPDEGWAFHVLARFEEHESMNYGSDSPGEQQSVKTIVSTSFYDRRVCLWQFDIAASS